MPSQLKSFLDSLSATYKHVAGFVALAAILWGAVGTVDWRIETKIRDQEYMTQLANRLRPVLIFDSSGSVLSDHGALKLIEPPKVESVQEGGTEALRVTVTPREFLQSPPALESLDHQAVITSERGEGITWVFTIRWKVFIEVRESARQEEVARFRLEVLF